jgi:hypothetical protein
MTLHQLPFRSGTGFLNTYTTCYSTKKRFQVANNLQTTQMKSSIPSLSNYLDENLAQDEFNDEVSNGIVAPTLPQQNQVASSSQSDLSLNLITQQLAILGQQIELLKGNTTITAANQTIVPKVNGMAPKSLAEVRTAEEIAEHNKPLELLQESKRRPMK